MANTTEGLSGGSQDSTTSVSAGTTGSAPTVCDEMGFLDSLDAWETARDKNNNSYWYIGIRHDDPCCGPTACCAGQTLVVVEAGEVVQRRLFEPLAADCFEGSCPAPWTEIGEEVGGHVAHELAVPPWTLDEVYASCCVDIIQDDTRGFEPSVQYHDDGLLRVCFANSGQGGFGPEGWGGDELSVLAIGFGEPPTEPITP